MLSKSAIFISLPILILGQICLEPSPNSPDICCTGPTLSDDNPPDECLTPNTTVLDFINSGICNENFDCCLCTEININDARSFTCGGDQSCIGVPLNIYGNSLGAVLTCGGDLSCNSCVITAENLSDIRCDGDKACQNTIMNINQESGLSTTKGILIPCNGDQTCEGSIINAKNVIGLLCNGDESCKDTNIEFLCKTNGLDTGCPIVAGGDGGLESAILDVLHGTKLQCGGDNSCQNANINMTCVTKGCNINCGGDDSCSQSKLNFNNVMLVECVGDKACLKATVIAECILPLGCPIRCSSESPCRLAKFTITNSAGLLCGGLGNACRDAEFKLINNVGGTFNCLGNFGCTNAIFNGGFKIDPTGNTETLPITNIREVLCSGLESCFNADIFIECDENTGCPAICSGNNACSNVDDTTMIVLYNVKSLVCSGNIIDQPSCNGFIDLIPIDTGFFISCAASSACQSGTIISLFENELNSFRSITCTAERSCNLSNFDIVYRGNGPFIFGSLICGGLKSCDSMYLKFTGETSEFTQDMISCTGIESCANANFEITATSVSLTISCTGLDSCNKLTITINADGFNVIATCNIVNLKNTCQDAVVLDIQTNTTIPLIDFS